MYDLSDQITAALGPTNTGKTHLAVERMLARSSGMIGLPLRLLAREVYDRVVRAKGKGAAALITGEEKIVPKGARYFVCTAEAMPVSKRVAFMAIDEVQLAADPERGHVFTDRMLNARGTEETMLLGSSTMSNLVRHLVPEAEIVGRERFSQLTYSGPSKLTRLPRRSAIVAFSAESVYAIAELLRRRRGGAAVVMGSLSPRTRNAQVELYQSGEVDFLVATDAIGMGLNMDVDHVAFAETRKFDGRRRRRLTAAELGQIAGRAGRFRTDGTFGETGECLPLDPDLVDAIERHEFAPVEKLHWRNPDLDTSSLDALQASLNRPAPTRALERVREAIDEQSLGVLATDREITERLTSPAMVERLWDTCRLPDFRKATLDAHARLIKSIFMHLSGRQGRLPDSWMAAQLDRVDKTSGDVDVLASRLAYVRTWTYAAHRSNWTRNPEEWRARSREVEDKLSDALHERLMQRFVDRRTQALVRGLKDEKDMLAGVSHTGEVTVEGHYVGQLEGLVFQPDVQGRELEARTLRSAALRALRPEINRRLHRLGKMDETKLTITPTGGLVWEEQEVGRLVAGQSLLRPGVKLIGGDLGAADSQALARDGIEKAVHARTQALLGPLITLSDDAALAELPGTARGLAWRLYEAGGALPRRDIHDDVQALDPEARRGLRRLGVRIGEHILYMPALVKPAAARHYGLLRAIHAKREDIDWFPPAGLTSVANDRAHSRADYAAVGFYPCGPRAIRFDMVERLADAIRDARAKMEKGKFELNADMTALLGCSVEDLRGVLTALGYRRVQKGEDPEKLAGEIWAMRRNTRPARPAPKPRAKTAEPVTIDANSPFAALAALKPVEEAAAPKKPRKRKRNRKPKKAETGDAVVETVAEAVTETPPETLAETPAKAPAETVASTATDAPVETQAETGEPAVTADAASDKASE